MQHVILDNDKHYVTDLYIYYTIILEYTPSTYKKNAVKEHATWYGLDKYPPKVYMLKSSHPAYRDIEMLWNF